jgi:hypothetical protein
MNRAIRDYLAEIGRRGGAKSRRRLHPDTARAMVRVREARRAVHKFRTQCFWSCDPAYVVTARDVTWVSEQLMKYGGRDAWETGARLCR